MWLLYFILTFSEKRRAEREVGGLVGHWSMKWWLQKSMIWENREEQNKIQVVCVEEGKKETNENLITKKDIDNSLSMTCNCPAITLFPKGHEDKIMPTDILFFLFFHNFNFYLIITSSLHCQDRCLVSF